MMGKPPFAVRKLDHVVLRVRDRERAIAFYCDILGLPLEREQSELGLSQLRAGSALLDLVTLAGRLGQAGGGAAGEQCRNVDHIAFRIEPFDEAALHAHLEGHGVPHAPAAPRYGADGEGPSIYITDPDGNTVELKG